jgi:HAE1 family hydrophobic/amphiphilic exporter-1
MARAVVGGLITSTLLTLIVVPVVYTILDDITAWLFKKGVRAAKAAAVGLAAVALVAGVSATASAQAAAPGAPGPQASLTVAIGQAAKAAAQDAAAQPGPKVLTLDQALAIAAEKNRDIQKAIEYQKWVQGKYLQERSYALPQASFSGSLMRNYDSRQRDLFKMFGTGDGSSDGSGSSVDIGEIFSGRQDAATAQFKVTQVLFTWGQVGAAIRAAKLGFGLADEQLRRFRQDVERDVTAGFYEVLVARELVTIAELDLAQKQRHLDEATKRQSAGTATDYDVLAAQVAVENARPNVIRAQNLVRTTRLQLAYLLAETGEIDATGTLATPLEPVPPYQETVTRALANRPDLGELTNTRGIYNELVTIAKANDKPRVDFSAGWGAGWVGLKSVSSHGYLWNAGVFASVPLFDGYRTKGLVAQARSDLSRISLDEMKLRDAVALQVQGAIDAVKEASEIVTALSGTVTQAEKLLTLAEKGFELGVKTRLEVQDAELNLSNARLSLARAQRDYRVARVNLEWVMGTLDGGKPAPATTGGKK